MLDGRPRILLIRLSAIGDVVRVLPAMHAIRDFFPRAQLDWVVERKSADILEGHPNLDRVLVFERPSGKAAAVSEFVSLIRDVRRNRYDIVVDFHGIFKSGMLALFSGAGERYGFAAPRGQEGSAWCANRLVRLPSKDLNRVEENFRLIEPFAPRPRNVNFSAFVPADDDFIDSFFDENFSGGKLVVGLHPAVDRPEKQWPLSRYAELSDMLLADGRFDVIISYGPGQRKLAEAVADQTRRKPALAPETADLKAYALLIQRCGLYVGGDTGPMHIAAAVGTPVVAIFGGTDPRKHKPFGQVSEILYEGGNGISASEALDKVSAEMVYDACVRMLHRGTDETLEDRQHADNEGKSRIR